MVDDNVKALDRFEAHAETPTGKATSRIVNYAFAALVSALLVLILGSLNRTNDIATSEQMHNYAQDQTMAVMAKTDAQQDADIHSQREATMAQTQAMQALTVALTKLADKVDAIGDTQKQILQHYQKPQR